MASLSEAVEMEALNNLKELPYYRTATRIPQYLTLRKVGISVMEARSDFQARIEDYLKHLRGSQIHDYSFLNGKWADFNQWKVMARSKFFQLANYFPREAPLDAIVLEVKERKGYRQEEAEFNTGEKIRVRCSVLVPDSGKQVYPAVIALHDHGGFYFFGREKLIETAGEPGILTRFKEEAYEGRSWASELARRGYLVLCIDAFYFGTRKPAFEIYKDEDLPGKFRLDSLKNLEYGTDEYIEEYNRLCWLYEEYMVRDIMVSGTTWPGILFHDDRKSIDYLLSRNDVNRECIGCCGLSTGGLRSVHLAGLDSRIKASVVAGWMVPFQSLLLEKCREHTFMAYVPNITSYMDIPDIAGMTAPNPMLVQQCSQDSLFTTEGMRTACNKIDSIYNKLGCADRFMYKFYDNRHQFNIIMQEDAFGWFDRWLK